MAARRLRARVIGRVQGVFYRATAEERARGLGLSGWVRNADDGSVEVVAEGDEERLQQLLGWLQRGPSGARVEQVQADWAEPSGRYPDFRVVHRPPAGD